MFPKSFAHYSLISALFLATLCAQATTLSTNLTAGTEYTELIEGSTWITAGFGTDASSYNLTLITALMQQDAAGTLNLDLYSNANNQPARLLGRLTDPGSYPAGGLGPASFGGANLSLAANTTYWLVMDAPVSGTYEWAYASGNAGSGPGFKGTWGVSANSGTSWFTSDWQPMQMSIEANSISGTPEPGSSCLLLCGSLLVAANLGLRKRNSRRKAREAGS